MNFARTLALVTMFALSAVAAPAMAKGGGGGGNKFGTYFCDMKGTWTNASGAKDDFIFLAEYMAKDGPDYFAGKYENLGHSSADIIGNANNGLWVIILTYTDPGHKGMLKKATGKGGRDGGKNEVTVEGTYKTFLGSNDIKADGLFRLHGKCRRNRN